MTQLIDESGYRANVGIILANNDGKLFWGKRIGQQAWQFPQGGLDEGETLEQALYRELFEEVGLKKQDVTILGQTKNWLRYRIPKGLIRDTRPLCIGQKQQWFLLRVNVADDEIHLERSGKPEFDDFLWVSYWYPLREVVGFKKNVYRRALKELLPCLYPEMVDQYKMRPLNHLLD